MTAAELDSCQPRASDLKSSEKKDHDARVSVQLLNAYLLSDVERGKAAADLRAALVPAGSSRSVAMTVAPSVWKRAAMARPMPRAAPVTTQSLLCSLCMMPFGREGCSFLKERTKELLSVWKRARPTSPISTDKSLFASFSSEKEDCLLRRRLQSRRFSVRQSRRRGGDAPSPATTGS